MDDIYRSKFIAPTEPPTTTYPPILKNSCESTSLIPTCSEIGYSQAYIPNFRLLESLEDIQRELNDFNPLIASACSNAIAHLLCSVYAPFCYTDDQNIATRLHPCTELCVHVRDGCESTMESFGMPWPQQLDCTDSEIYKPRNSTDTLVYCPTDIQAVHIPPNISPHKPRCENISNIPVCAEIGYSSALFPNTRHQTPSDANKDLSNLQPLLDSNCSVHLPRLLCSVNAPFCYVNSSNKAVGIQTCSELCYFVKKSCESVLLQYNLQWPTYLDCNNENFRPNDSLTYCPQASNLNVSGPTEATPTQITPIISTMPTVTEPPPNPLLSGRNIRSKSSNKENRSF